jgi:D-serine dehydratase
LKTIEDPLQDIGLDWTYKGIDSQMEGRNPRALGELNRSIFDDQLLLPVAVLKTSVVRRNSAWMRQFLARTGVMIAPHGKTSMAPDLFRIQVADGVWALTAATVHHVRAYRRFGVERVLMANQLVGDAGMRWVLTELAAHPQFDFYCFVDSIDNIVALTNAARQMQCRRPIQVLIEVGGADGRAGVRTLERGLEIASAVAGAHPFLDLVGVAAFEGIYQVLPDGEHRARAMLDTVRDLAVACDERGFFQHHIILTAGGSGYFDLAARVLSDGMFSRTPQVVIRSGCYLTHDQGLYADLYTKLLARSPELGSLGPGLEPALQVWGQVLSRPEPSRVICGVGKRDIGHDMHLPTLDSWARPQDRTPRTLPLGCSVVALNDQHAYVDGPVDMPFAVGDLVAFGVSHPCTTFDKWRVLLLVDEDHRINGALRTYF